MSSDWRRRMDDGELFARSGALPRAREAFRDAWEAATDDRERSRALGGLGVVADQLGDPVARTLLEEAVELARAADPDGLPLRLHDLGVCRIGRGDRSGVAALEEAWPLRADDRQRLSSVEALAAGLLQLGALREAESAFLQAAWLAEQVGVPLASARAINGRGEALRRQGRPEEARRAFQSVAERLGALPDPNEAQREQAGVALHNLGVLFAEARPEAAQQLFEEAIRCFEGAYGTRRHTHVARSVVFLARLARDAGRADAAAQRLDEARRLVPSSDPVVTELIPMLGLA